MLQPVDPCSRRNAQSGTDLWAISNQQIKQSTIHNANVPGQLHLNHLHLLHHLLLTFSSALYIICFLSSLSLHLPSVATCISTSQNYRRHCAYLRPPAQPECATALLTHAILTDRCALLPSYSFHEIANSDKYHHTPRALISLYPHMLLLSRHNPVPRRPLLRPLPVRTHILCPIFQIPIIHP